MTTKEINPSDEPAVICADGTVEYFKIGNSHYMSGPAIISSYKWNGKPVTKEQYEKLKREYDLKKVVEGLLNG